MYHDKYNYIYMLGSSKFFHPYRLFYYLDHPIIPTA
jgi:hypothetical protein